MLAAFGLTGCEARQAPVASAPSGSEVAMPTASASTRALPQGWLRVAEPRTAELSPGEIHSFNLDLATDDAILLEVDQSQVDVEVTLDDPDGHKMLVVDLPVGTEAPEHVCFVAPRAGAFGLRIAPYGRGKGTYRVSLLRLRPASPSDRDCSDALEAFLSAENRRFLGGASPDITQELVHAHDLARQAGEPFLAALALRQAGALWLKLNRGAPALAAFRQALPLARQAESAFLEISLLNRLAMALLDSGEIGLCDEALQQALDLSERLDYLWGEALTLHSMGDAERIAGEAHQAIELYQRALPKSRQLALETEHAVTLQRLGDVYAQLDHPREALEVLGEAAAVFRAAGNLDRQASTLLSTGWVQVLNDNAEDAIPLFREAIEIQQRLGHRKGEAAAVDRLGTALLATEDYPAALSAYQRALDLAQVTGSRRDLANSVANIGCLYQRWGKVEEAASQLTEAQSQLRAVDDLKALSNVESCLARLEQQQGHLAEALHHIEASLTLVEGIRATARQRGARYRPIRLWQEYTELQIELLLAHYLETGDQALEARAFEISDLARARNLYDLVLESQIGVRTTAPQALLARERQIQRRLNAVEERRRRMREAEVEAAEISGIEARLGELALELERARAAIRAADPRFAELAEPRPIRLADLQNLLPEQTLLLSFALGEKHSTLFVVGASTFTSKILPPRRRIDAQAKALYEALRESRHGGFQQDLAAETLGEMLFEGVEIVPTIRRILVVADGMLHYVPLGVLPSPLDDGANPGRLLGDDFEIQVVPSASVLAALIERDTGRRDPPKTVAIFADALYSAEDPRLRTGAEPGDTTPTPVSGQRSVSIERLPDGPLPRLPHTASEARSILSLLPSDQTTAALGYPANKQAVLDQHLAEYRILHFATHAFIDDRFPDLSGLVLSRLDHQGQTIDGHLHLHEIYGLELAADLVVLSGCQTALGPEVRGDGLLSLTRGFLYAGSSQVLVSLWSVDDEATAYLMAEFYRSMIQDGESPAAALRSAQRWMRQQPHWSAPYFWAAFVLQGAVS